MASIDDLWKDFWAWTERHAAGTYLFRGQADNSPILPKIGRAGYGYAPARERAMFDAFERASRPFVQGHALTLFETLALAQHHGAPTRLVDWSTSPLVAAWFAVSSYPSATDAAVFALDPTSSAVTILDAKTCKTSTGTSLTDPMLVSSGVYLFETAPVSARITTQRGIFTLHGDPTIAMPVPASETFDIPGGLRDAFQSRLLDLGIDASFIFPDLDGLCRTLDWRMKSGKGFSSIA